MHKLILKCLIVKYLIFLIHCSPICKNSRNLLILQINPRIKLKLIAERYLNTAKFATSEIRSNKMDLMIT